MDSTKQTGILMKGDMVRATLEGLKTQTRRIIKPDWWRQRLAEAPPERAAPMTLVDECRAEISKLQGLHRKAQNQVDRLQADVDALRGRRDHWKARAQKAEALLKKALFHLEDPSRYWGGGGKEELEAAMASDRGGQ